MKTENVTINELVKEILSLTPAEREELLKEWKNKDV